VKTRSAFHKICIVQTAFAGDVILTTPLIRATAMCFPEAEIDFIAIPSTSNLLKNNPHVNRVMVYDKRNADRGIASLVRWTGRLRRHKYDLALVPHRSIRSALLVSGAGIPVRIGFHNSAGSFFFNHKVIYPRHVHEVERNGYLLHPLGLRMKMGVPELFPGEAEKRRIDRFLLESGLNQKDGFISAAPGSVWATKRWLPEGFARVIREVWERHGIRTVLVGSDSEQDLAGWIVREAGEGAVNAMGRFSMLASAELIRQSRLLISNDSAPLHLGVAVRRPVIALFGPTVPDFGFAPFGPGNVVIERPVACRPCGIHGGNRCPKGHFRCMKEIRPEEVLEAVESKLL
jgi:heptosyltransferase-2